MNTSPPTGILRGAYSALMGAFCARQRHFYPATFRARCERLMELEGTEPTPAAWVMAAATFSEGGYPSKDLIEPLPGWGGLASRRIHGELGSFAREWGCGDLHDAFWSYCFMVCGRVPQEMDQRAVRQVLDLFYSERAPSIFEVA